MNKPNIGISYFEKSYKIPYQTNGGQDYIPRRVNTDRHPQTNHFIKEFKYSTNTKILH